jgi:hypothetical protein
VPAKGLGSAFLLSGLFSRFIQKLFVRFDLAHGLIMFVWMSDDGKITIF